MTPWISSKGNQRPEALILRLAELVDVRQGDFTSEDHFRVVLGPVVSFSQLDSLQRITGSRREEEMSC